MAEFQEVCRQWRRMCLSFEDAAAQEYRPCAEKCPVGANPVCGELCNSTLNDLTKFETAIMKWAAEHPEPVYPTWWEWLENMGVVGKAKSEYSEVFDTICVGTRMFDHIPADIAQKLGIQPKEGT